ncbi:unnamed protein product, partial [Mesorhabditis belari]|uniref:RING-type E3 ubiquitin transferase n=1 Tax=Mesorhabditis belari TaxID=2138241 RepID=A0AAF3EQD1_9BILA
MLDSSGLDGLPFSGNNNDPRDMEMTDYDRERKVHKAHTENSEPIKMTVRTLGNELVCPICLDLLTNTMTTKECLHRFCQECITTALQRGNKECPTCRKKLVSRRSLRPDPNFDRLIEKIWPDRKVYEQMQSKSLEMFTQHSNMDSLRTSIFEGIKAQAATRRQRVAGSYDVGDTTDKRRKRKRNAAGELVEVEGGEVENGEPEGDSGSSGSGQNEETPTATMENDTNGDGHQENGTHEANPTNGTVNGNGEENAEVEEAGISEDLSIQTEENHIYDEVDLEEWKVVARDENLDDIQLRLDENGMDKDLWSDNTTETTESSSKSEESHLTVSSISDDTVPAHNGAEPAEEAPLPTGPCTLKDRMTKWLAQSPNSPQTPEEGELIRMTDDDFMEVNEQDPEIEIEFLPASSLAKRVHFKAMLEPRYLKTRYDTSMTHISEFLFNRFKEDTTNVHKDLEFKGISLSIADLERPEYFYVLNRQGGHHIKRIFLHENVHTAHGAATRDEHLIIFFDTRPQSLCANEQSVLTAVVPKQFLEQPIL